MATDAKAIGYLELNIKGFEDAIAVAKKALAGLAVAFAAFKTTEFFKEGIQDAIKFGEASYFAAQKLNGYDTGKLFLVQKALESGGLAAEEARGKIEEFAQAGRPLEQLFKGGSSGFADALTHAAQVYGTQAKILSDSAEKFAYVQQQLNEVGTKIQGFFLGLAEQISKPLSNFLAELDKIDLVGMGQQFGRYITDAINAISGLIKNQSLFSTISLALKVGFQEAINYLIGGVNAVMGILLDGKLWDGFGNAAIGALALIGNFLTSLVLGMGKLLVATVEAAFERLNQKYAYLSSFTEGFAGAFGAKYEHASTDVGENLKHIENNPLIKSQESGAKSINEEAFRVAKEGLKELADIKIEFKKGSLFDTTTDAAKLADAIQKGMAAGAASATPIGNKTPIYSGKSDAIGVIADSLARVGGGGRYIRTGLSIAEKAAIDSLRYQQQIADNTAILAGKSKTHAPVSTVRGG